MDKSVGFKRDKDRFSLLIPLADSDSQQAIATFEMLQELLNDDEDAEEFAVEFANSISLKRIQGKGLQVSMSLEKLTSLMIDQQSEMPGPTENLETTYRTTIASLKGRGLPVNSENALPQLIEQFKMNAGITTKRQ